jgi:hypothetical protein
MTCQQAAEAISVSADGPLSTSTRVGLGIHTLFCGPCRRFRRQVLRLNAACVEVFREESEPALSGLTPEARARIAAVLDNASSDRRNGEVS